MIGTKTIDITDSSRKELLSADDENRRIQIRFYYPGIDDYSQKPVRLLSQDKIKEYDTDPERTAFYNLRVKLYENLQVLEGSFPLILYSHGYSSCAEANSDLCRSLAENGYIVASIAHTYEASQVIFEDGTDIRFDKALLKKMMNPMIPALIHEIRLLKKRLSAQEALKAFNRHQKKYESFLIDRLPEWAADDRLAIAKIREMNEDPDSFLYQRIDFTHGIGATGHSFGGALAYYHCMLDDEITCGVNIDGGLFGEYGDQVNHKPFMQIDCPLNYNVVTRSFLYYDKPVHFLIFKDMKHIGFCDVKLLTRETKRTGTSDPVQTMDTLNAAHIAFFDRYLKQGETDNKELLDISRDALERYEVFYRS